MVAISATVYGFLLELAQNFLMPGDRFFSFGDAAANAAGAFAVSAAWRFWNWRRQ